MFKFPSVSGKQKGVIATLLVLIFLGASYFFIYVPDHEKTVQERRFRCLQNVDNNIHTAIENNFLLVNNLLSAYAAKVRNQGLTEYLDKYNKSLNKYYDSKANFTILENVHPGLENDRLTFFVNNARDKITRKTVGIYIQFEATQFIKPLLPSDVFDNYIVFYKDDIDHKSNKLYETFPSGLKGSADSLLQIKSKITSPGMRSITIGGTDYRIFSQPVSTGHEDNWIISGLASAKNYENEKNQLPLWIVLLLLTAAIGIIVSLPWIKLYHMGNKDKLTVRDGVASILVAMMLMSLLFFVLFKYNVSSLHLVKGSGSASSKDTLASKIRNAYENEINANYQLLDACDSAYASGKRSDIWSFGRGTLPGALLTKIKQPIKVHQVYWLDSAGKEKINWVADVGVPKGTDLSERDYFKNAIQNRPNRKGKNSFFLSQNFSRVTGVFTSVIAKKSAVPKEVAAIGFTIKSLDSVVMPDGYQFAIMDGSGKVLYHYHPELNLNENLKVEFADSSKLVSSLEAKSDTDFEAEYFGKRYNIKITPFRDLPYYTVIFENQEYTDTRDMEAYVFTLSMLILLLIFLIAEFTIVFFTSSKRSFFKKQIFETSWVGPKITSHLQYNLAIVANVVTIILLTIFFEPNSFLKYLYILLFSIVFVSIFLNASFAKSYRINNSYLYHFKLLAIGASCIFVVIIDFAACKTLKPDHIVQLFSYEIILIITCTILYFTGPGVLAKIYTYKKHLPFKWTYTQSFAMMATTRLIITCGIPVAFFFIYSFNYEQKLDTRYRQFKFAKQFIQKVDQEGVKNFGKNTFKTDSTTIDSIEKGLKYTSGIYYDGLYIDSVQLTSKPKNVTNYFGEDFATAGILSAFRFHMYDVEVKNNNMNLPDIDDSTTFSKIEHDKELLIGKHRGLGHKHFTRTTLKIDSNEYLRVSSGDISYPKPDWYFWISLALCIWLFYIIMHNIIKKLYALDLPSTAMWEKMDDQLLTNNKLNSLLLIIGPPGSGKLRRLKKKLAKNRLSESELNELLALEAEGLFDQMDKKLKQFKANRLLGNHNEILVYYDEDEYPDEEDKAQKNVFIADMIKIPVGAEQNDEDWKRLKENALNDSNALVIINHFEYNVKDPKTNGLKLDFLESLMQKGKAKIIIISTVHPLTFLNSFNEQQNNSKPDNKETSTATPPVPSRPTIDESELERWHVVLGHYRIIIEPMEQKDAGDPDVLRQYIKQETEYGHFLHKMRDITLADISPTKNADEISSVSDSLIFKVQIVSHYFYTYIWQSLTKEEKFLLYDLAEDGLVNPYDDYNLCMLISKGLIIKNNGMLMLFNKGFRNYILTAIGETEVNRIKEQVKDNGNWNSLKIPLNLTILAILIFLFTSQQEAYSRIITYITAFSAGIPAVMKVFSLFGNSTQKTQ